MPMQMSGYDSAESAKNTELKEITITTGSSKTFQNVSTVEEPLNQLHDMNTRSDGNPVYQGWALPGTGSGNTEAGWKICFNEFNSIGMLTAKTWASGNATMDKLWTDRDKYPYS